MLTCASTILVDNQVSIIQIAYTLFIVAASSLSRHILEKVHTYLHIGLHFQCQYLYYCLLGGLNPPAVSPLTSGGP